MKRIFFILPVILVFSCASFPPMKQLPPPIVPPEIDSFYIKEVKLDFKYFSDDYFTLDALSNPDIYLVIYDGNDNPLIRYEPFQDVDIKMYPLTWRGSTIQLPNHHVYKIRVFDEDITKSDLVTETTLFRIDCTSVDQVIYYETKLGNRIYLMLTPHYINK